MRRPLFFFFTSRRRHTRFDCDWSSDVCSSDLTQCLVDGLRDRARLSAGRAAAPSAAIIDSQSVRAAETVSRATRGYDAGKKVQGRKRHIVVDTAGFLLAVLVTPASTQDRVAARYLLR